MYGTAIGSVFPGFGNLIGGVVGGVAGAITGALGARAVAEQLLPGTDNTVVEKAIDAGVEAEESTALKVATEATKLAPAPATPEAATVVADEIIDSDVAVAKPRRKPNRGHKKRRIMRKIKVEKKEVPQMDLSVFEKKKTDLEEIKDHYIGEKTIEEKGKPITSIDNPPSGNFWNKVFKRPPNYKSSFDGLSKKKGAIVLGWKEEQCTMEEMLQKEMEFIDNKDLSLKERREMAARALGWFDQEETKAPPDRWFDSPVEKKIQRVPVVATGGLQML